MSAINKLKINDVTYDIEVAHIDASPTENSDKPVTSGGVHSALANKQGTLTFDDAPTENSDNPVKSGGLYTALAGKQSTLTFDTTPTANSDNPVKSGGVKTALDGKKNTQSAVSDPTASGTEIAFIDSVSQNVQGVITPTKKTVRSATGSQSGVVTLSDAYTTSGGAAANSVGASSKAVNDLYNDAVSTAEAKKAYHLNFYIDGDGDLCQAD